MDSCPSRPEWAHFLIPAIQEAVMRLLVGIIVAATLFVTSAGIASAGNSHCAGQSSNVNLPSGHVNDFAGCK
jgi:hypothetical protein